MNVLNIFGWTSCIFHQVQGNSVRIELLCLFLFCFVYLCYDKLRFVLCFLYLSKFSFLLFFHFHYWTSTTKLTLTQCLRALSVSTWLLTGASGALVARQWCTPLSPAAAQAWQERRLMVKCTISHLRFKELNSRVFGAYSSIISPLKKSQLLAFMYSFFSFKNYDGERLALSRMHLYMKQSVWNSFCLSSFLSS